MGPVHRLLGVLAQATPSPSPTPGLREGLEESAISPGLAGFLAIFGVALASVLLFYSMTGKLRGVRVRDGVATTVEAPVQAAGRPAPAGSVADDGVPAASSQDGTADDGASGSPDDGGPAGAPENDDDAATGAEGSARS